VSYTGESLDYKAPLLKSLHTVEEAAVQVCRLFDKNITRVYPTLGIEQEYFLVDSALFKARPDLVMAGRTVFGHAPARGQQLSDHYFGSIPERVLNFMVDVEQEAHKLGIPLTTRHNEVAPSQFECAPIFQRINIACDQNQLLMDLMDKIAKKHNFEILFHEKPFKGVNGSGKHNNWSLSTDTGINLLSPSKTPKNNLMFLTFFVNTIKAFFDHADIIRAAIASAGNDHRLGANEAPPAIMSIFAGEQLNRILDEIENSDFANNDKDAKNLMKHGIKSLPEILLDNTDRNRTSPFAFTGNKFELRAVGSADNSAFVMTVLNTIVAAQLRKFYAEVEKIVGDSGNKDSAILSVLQGYIKQSKNIRFEGNGYSQEWADEAEKRGLPNVRSTPQALNALISKKAIKVFKDEKVFSEGEINARYAVALDNYALKIQIEGRMMAELATAYILPSAINFQNKLIANLQGQKDLGIDAQVFAPQMALVVEISKHIASATTLAQQLNAAIDHLDGGEHGGGTQEESYKTAVGYCDDVKAKYFDALRHHIDSLETLVDDAEWALPKYRELLFMR
jgi:glutamine synthetase